VARRLPRIERQQERPREPLFTRVEELIDQILLNPDVSSDAPWLPGQASFAEEITRPRMATTASLPAVDTTDSFTCPD